MALWCATGPVLSYAMDLDPDTASKAQFWAVVSALGLPAHLVLSALQSFLTAKQVTYPSAIITIFGAALYLLLGLLLVFGVALPGFHGWGFQACPWLSVITETASGSSSHALPAASRRASTFSPRRLSLSGTPCAACSSSPALAQAPVCRVAPSCASFHPTLSSLSIRHSHV
eukprot:3937620-Rhodomonas_salina.3